jgi:glycosyltransferase involved in cell wall biosynthesis
MKILMHLRSDWRDLPGGDVVQLQRWTVWLLELGHDVEVSDAELPDLRGVDIVHFHHLGRAALLEPTLEHCRRAGVATVLTPLYWPTQEYDTLGRPGLTGWVAAVLPRPWRELARQAGQAWRHGRLSVWRLLRQGGQRQILRFLSGFDALVANSLAEVDALHQILPILPPTCIVPSGVDAFYWSDQRSLWALEGDWLLPDGSRLRCDLEDYKAPPPVPDEERHGVLCVARFDPQKAQHLLLAALEPLQVPVTLVGGDNPHHPDYRAYCRRLAWPGVRILSRVKPGVLKELYQTCRVHVLASWYETTGLTALEAGCCGARSVITSRGGTREYAGDLAWYCHPSDPASIRRAVEAALHAPQTPDLLGRVQKNFTWELSTRRLLSVYRSVLEGRPASSSLSTNS